MSKHKWIDEEDDIIVLHAYLSTLTGTSWVKADERGAALINRRSQRDGVVGVNSIVRRMLNVKYLDTGEGFASCAKLTQRVFAEYRNAPDKLKKRMAEIKKELGE